MNKNIKRILSKPFIKNIDSNSLKFLKKSLIKLYKHGFCVKFYKHEIRSKKNKNCGGELDPEFKILRVGHISKNHFQHDSWLAIFAHEYCHFLQYLEDNNFIDKYKTSNGAARVEFDCEKRAIRQMKRYGLPINIKEYKAVANGYVCLYYCQNYFGNETYYKFITRMLHLMPDKFSLNFDKFIKNNYKFLEEKVFI